MRTFAAASMGAGAHKAHRGRPSAHRQRSQWINRGSWAALAGQGFSSTILPSFNTATGVPCIFATFRATLAERFNARPTAATNSSLRFDLVDFFLVIRTFN